MEGPVAETLKVEAAGAWTVVGGIITVRGVVWTLELVVGRKLALLLDLLEVLTALLVVCFGVCFVVLFGFGLVGVFAETAVLKGAVDIVVVTRTMLVGEELLDVVLGNDVLVLEHDEAIVKETLLTNMRWVVQLAVRLPTTTVVIQLVQKQLLEAGDLGTSHSLGPGKYSW